MTHIFKISAFFLLMALAVSLRSNAQNFTFDQENDSFRKAIGLPSFDSLLSLKGYDQIQIIEKIWIKNLTEEKKGTLIELFREIEKSAAANKNPDLEMKAAFLLIGVQEGIYSYENHILKYENLVKRAEKSGVFWAEMEAKINYSLYLSRSIKPEQIEEGIWLLKETIDKIKKKGSTNFPKLLAYSYHILSSIYYTLGDFSDAIIYGKKSLGIQFPNGRDIASGDLDPIHSLNNLGVFYREQNLLDSSSYYFKEVLNLSLDKNDTVYYAISSGNLGENLYLKGYYEEALPLLQIDADMALKLGDWGLASNGLVLIADIFLIKNDLETAKQMLDQASISTRFSHQLKRFGKLYPIQSKYYKALGQSSLALAYADSTIMVMDSLKAQNKPFYGVRLESFFNEYQAKMDALQEQEIQNKAIQQRNIGLIFLLFILLISYLLFRQYKLKVKLKEGILLREVEHVQDELAFAKELLHTYIREITAQNDSVHWEETKIGSDEQWKKFLELFNKSYPDFVKRVRSTFSSITSGDIRLLCVSRLGLDDSAMASILGVNVNSVSQTRRRFMRKRKIENIHAFKALILSI